MNPIDNDDLFDAAADATIRACLDLSAPKSFLLYAGAGSGKTRSLVNAIRYVCQAQGRRLALNGQQIGVITYTNAACDEIKQRLEFDPRVEVSTIHSFAWALINGYNHDIRNWLETNLLSEIANLQQQQAKGRANSKAAHDRAQALVSKQNRYNKLDVITRFVYSPSGDNSTQGSLNHAEVIAMTASFLETKPGLRRLLIGHFPILLIDESQDTTRQLMDALLVVQKAHADTFCLGLFGDMMQRIYADGKVDLAECVPETWERPIKAMNHRCPKRVVKLINKIRADDDKHVQRARVDAPAGVVRLFIVPESGVDKPAVEIAISNLMAEFSNEPGWLYGSNKVKALALEHMMSARRFGFDSFFEPLYRSERLRTGLLDGTGSGLGLFTRELLPLAHALAAGSHFDVAAVVRRTSPLLERKVLEDAGEEQRELLDRANQACDGLRKLLFGETSPSLRAVLKYVSETSLFTIPDVLMPFVADDPVDLNDDDEINTVDAYSELVAWRLALEAPFEQIGKYDLYVRGISQFDTHQGVKGLEFPRVMVIISDAEARGFMFDFDKLIGIKDRSDGDRKNVAEGKDTTVDRTRRLFYVTCSRAEQSLAVIYYSDNPTAVRDAMLERGWFSSEEVIILQP